MSADHTFPALPVQDGVEFRHCPDWPGYCVGNNGSVWSCWRWGGRSTMDQFWRKLRPALKDPQIADGGYHVVCPHRNKLKKMKKVHVLILEAFIGPCPTGMVCRHLDGCGTNNRLENLCWGTFQENFADMRRHGRSGDGERNHQTNLTKEQIEEIKILVASGLSQRSVGERFGIGQPAISRIVNGKRWIHSS